MEPREALSQIPARDVPLTYGEDVFGQYSRGEIDLRAYQVLNAAWVSQYPHHYPAVVYPPLSANVKDYMDGRLNDAREYDASLAAKLGQWVEAVVRAYGENEENESLFQWCLDVLKGESVGNAQERLELALRRVRSIPFPHVEMRRAVWVKQRDADVRARKGIT